MIPTLDMSRITEIATPSPTINPAQTTPVQERAARNAPTRQNSTPRHLLSLDALTPAEMTRLLAAAARLKLARQHEPTMAPFAPLAGRTVALLFEKPSLRTRVSFEVAARELGGGSLYLAPQEVGLGKREAVRDVAQVLSSYVHAIVVRTFSHAILTEFAAHSAVPVINGLTDAHHPCQGLADMLTIGEVFGATQGRTLAYVGDGNNVAHSLLQAALYAGMRVHIATPAGYAPDPAIVAAALAAAPMGASLTVTTNPTEAVTGADVVYTDVWASMGQEAEAEQRRAIFAAYQVNAALMAHAAPHAIALHPLPAHRGEEIADDVLDGPQAQVWAQAENRLHVQKAALLWLLAPDALA
ncbi:MAG TPA: ornithine carbamoyltransferase [Ktedonobacterales bacterium]|nr:ornithine carbamoyltransferase [Ktedonobacterales bacterium]